MELNTTGNFSLDNEISNKLIKGQIFGLELDLLPEGLVYSQGRYTYRFLRDKGERISGVIDLGNGGRCRLVAYFISQDPDSKKGHFRYTLSELSDGADTDDSSHPSNMGKMW